VSKPILCADDSASIRQMVSFTLKSAGYEPVMAQDGRDALAKAAERRFAMVITDLNMPGLDGIELIRQLRAKPAYQGVPIVMLTTESEEAKKQAGRQAGAVGWIVKPFDQAKLVAVVKKLLGDPA
jgi:two-component system chemotaxis response regulator CheY